MSLVVCIDATLPGLALSLADTDRILWQMVHTEQNKSSHLMGRFLHEGLSRIGKRVEDIEAVMVAVGPGSFTGIKVSLAFAYGFVETSISRRTSLGVSSIGLLAEERARHFNQPVAVLLRSTQTAGYLCLAEPGKLSTCYVLQLEKTRHLIYNAQTVIARTAVETSKILSNFKLIALGAWPEARQVIEVSIEDVTVDDALHNSLRLMQDIFRAEWPQGFSPEIPEPLYLRPSSPEEKILLTQLSE